MITMYNSPYKPVPPPKPLGGNAPPYRVPPPFPIPGSSGRQERHPIDMPPPNAIVGNGYGPAVTGPAPTVVSHPEFDNSREHYHTHSNKFPVEKNIEINDHDKETLEDSRFRSKAPPSADAQRFPVARSSWRGAVFPNEGAIRPPAPAWQRDLHPDGHQGYWELSRIRPPAPHANGSTPHQHPGHGHPSQSLVYHPPNLPARHHPPSHLYDRQHPPPPHQNGRYHGDDRDQLVYSGPNRSSIGLIGVDNPALDGNDEIVTTATPQQTSERSDGARAESGETEAKKKTGKAKEYAEKKYSKFKGMISKFGHNSSPSRNNEKKPDSRATTPSKDSPNEEEHGFTAAQEQQQPNQNIPMQSLSGQTTPKRSPHPSRSHGDLTGVGNSRTPPIYRHSAVIGQPGPGMGPRILPATPNFRPQHAISSESPYGGSGYDLYSRPIHGGFRPAMPHPQVQRQPNSLKEVPSVAEMNRSRDGLAPEPLSLPGMVANPDQIVDNSMIGRNRRAGVVLDSDDDDGDEKHTAEAFRNDVMVRNQEQRVSGMSNRRPGVGQESGSCINTSQESSDGAIAVEQRRTSSETLAAADAKALYSNRRDVERSSWAGPQPPQTSGPPPLPSDPPPSKTPPPLVKAANTPEKPERTDLPKLRHPFMGGSTNQIAQSPKDKKNRPGGIHDSTPAQMRSEFLHFSKTSVSYAGGLNLSGRMETARPAGDGDASSTTTALESESFLDQEVSEESSNEEEVKYGRTRRHSAQQTSQMRNQLEELEEIYSQVLRLLKGGKGGVPGQPAAAVNVEDLKAEFKKSQARMRRFGSVSSLPSSTTGPRYRIKDRRDDKRRGKDSKSGNSFTKRFQRLESHIVTLARSVAQLSSEMRNQHLMIQEIENLRREVAEVAAWKGISLRTGTGPGAGKPAHNVGSGPWDTYRCSLPAFANPNRVKKLTKFFGTEPPLLRQFLRKLGYEKYATLFENEKIGMMELPYLSENRLEKLGVPLGPRVRILQEAQMNFGNDKYNIYIV